jgi:1-acyl-sn-glycerol-3-phosphate acyltransferase
VANHQSQYDIVALYGWLGIDFRWVMKQELRKIPALGYASEKIGHIFIDRSNTKKAMESLENAKAKIKDGTSVIFFPEGTRSKTGELGKFKKGAFKMACDLGLPILPVTINGTREIIQTKSLLLYPGKALITIHAPIPTTDKTDSALMEEARLVMEKGLKE